MQQGTRTKINELNTTTAQVYQDVLILDITMDNSTGMAVLDSCHYLGKEAAATAFTQWALLCDVVKKILGGHGPLKDQHEALWCLKPVKQADHTWMPIAFAHLPQQRYLKWASD